MVLAQFLLCLCHKMVGIVLNLNIVLNLQQRKMQLSFLFMVQLAKVPVLQAILASKEWERQKASWQVYMVMCGQHIVHAKVRWGRVIWGQIDGKKESLFVMAPLLLSFLSQDCSQARSFIFRMLIKMFLFYQAFRRWGLNGWSGLLVPIWGV